MLKVAELQRQFVYAGNTLADPTPALSVDQVRETYADQYPELTNAAVDDGGNENGIITYEFSVSSGAKG